VFSWRDCQPRVYDPAAALHDRQWCAKVLSAIGRRVLLNRGIASRSGRSWVELRRYRAAVAIRLTASRFGQSIIDPLDPANFGSCPFSCEIAETVKSEVHTDWVIR
jgi:hypothetical protein